MAVVSIVLNMVGGLCMFLFGMKMMSEGLQRSAGERMRKALNFMTKNRFIGVFTGFMVTAIVQSSSAVSVMVISFVTAGLLSLTQSISVLFGANIGTTLTAWIVSLIGFKIKIDALAIPAIGIGFILKAINWKHKSLGEFLLGFGFLFLGLYYLSEGIGNVEFNAHAIEAFKNMGFAAILIAFGTSFVMTLIINSSTAAVAMIIIMAGSNVITYEMAAGMILGANVGTTTDGVLAAIGGTADAKRAALSHVLFNVILACWAIPMLRLVLKLVDVIVPGDPVIVFNAEGHIIDSTAIGFHLAMLHTTFKVLNTILFLPFINQYARLLTFIIRKKETEVKQMDAHYKFAYLSTSIADSPELNILRAEKEIRDMAGIVSTMYTRFCTVLRTLHEAEGAKREETVAALCEELEKKEEYIDDMRETLSSFLLECSKRESSTTSPRRRSVANALLRFSNRPEKRISNLLRVIGCLEEISNECHSVSRLLEKSVRKNYVFREKEMDKLIPYVGQVEEFLVMLEEQFGRTVTPEEKARAEELEKNIDKNRKKLNKLGRKRIEEGGDVRTELLFIDLVRRIEKLGNYCFDIAEAI